MRYKKIDGVHYKLQGDQLKRLGYKVEKIRRFRGKKSNKKQSKQ